MNKQSKVFSIFIIVLILNIISNYLNFKIDLTEDKKYTLSENSKEILLNVDDIISVKVYLNGELPSGFQMLKTSIKNFLTNISNQNKLIEFEFIITDDSKIYFLEINPRICGHIGQKDVNRNSIYYNKIIIPYFKEYGITLPQQLTVTDEYEGSNVRNIIPLMFNLNPILFITIGVIYAYVVILIIKKTGILNKI